MEAKLEDGKLVLTMPVEEGIKLEAVLGYLENPPASLIPWYDRIADVLEYSNESPLQGQSISRHTDKFAAQWAYKRIGVKD